MEVEREAEQLGLRALFCLFFPPLVDVLDFLSSESAKVTLLFERLMRLPRECFYSFTR